MNLNALEKKEDFFNGLKTLFADLNVPVNYIDEKSISPREILSRTFKENTEAYLLMDDVFVLGLVDNAAFEGKKSETIADISKGKKDYEGILIFGVTLKNRDKGLLPSRSQLAEITRAFNREFYYMPVVVVFRYDQFISIANAERITYKQEWREGEKAGKVSLLRDISVAKPHTGHLKILQELTISRTGKGAVNSFADLYTYWQSVFNVSILNKKFYEELSRWYFWALHEVAFPTASYAADKTSLLKDDERVKEHNAKNLIRMLTRLLFVWFVKEKNLIPEELFNETYIKDNLINGFEPRKKKNFDHKTQGSKYYRAILQNLFFATLNQTVGKREFRKGGQQMNVTNLMRYESYFKNPGAFIKLVENIVPFMNGGLFECLDSPDPLLKGKRGGEVIIYEDGFSDRKDNSLCVPDYIFFGADEHADLSEELGDKKHKDVNINGLINILNSYKFTVTENTPIEEDVALDPELLGRVFENLLASYNPETKTTARKQTGSFYTPREIVNYMVDESLKAYLKQKLETESGMKPEEAERKLELLIGYNETCFQDENRFDDKETTAIINAIDNCKILDPACGSGAFPMGILHKLVHVLHKLDADNKLWKEVQRQKAIRETEVAFNIGDKKERENRLKEISDVFEYNSDDYGRKLFLIENCIYGVDIQPIATQISKLRFFISLIVDQKADKARDNFGIRPLPNLETKFIAANTLIGIEKPKTGDFAGSLFDNTKVQELEENLKDVRHRLFSAKTPATKRNLRDEDQKLREEMGTLLEDAGWSNETARQLAGWDPYNQNASSPFFDPEWMFGVSNGFDVVIGNPPYKILTKNNTSIVELGYYLEKYKSIQGASSKNLFTIFIENALEILEKFSTLSFIVPEGLFKTRSYSGCVNQMERYGYTKSIVTFKEYVFENAVTGNLIFVFSKNQKGETSNFSFTKTFELNKLIHIENNLLQKITAGTQPLSELAISFKGMVVKDRDVVLSEIKKNKKNTFLLGKNISKWKIESKYFTNYDELEIIGGTKKLEKHNHYPRILVRRTGNTLCCAFLNEKALTESTLYSCWSISPKITDKVLLGLLNSSLLNYYNQELFITNKQGFPQILMTDLELLPIKIPNNFFQKIFSIIVDTIIQTKTIFSEHLIDAMVYELYFPDEIKAADAEVLKHLTNLPELKDDWNDEKKMKSIEKVYQELSDPKHPVAIAMERQKTVKEVRIIEGLDK